MIYWILSGSSESMPNGSISKNVIDTLSAVVLFIKGPFSTYRCESRRSLPCYISVTRSVQLVKFVRRIPYLPRFLLIICIALRRLFHGFARNMYQKSSKYTSLAFFLSRGQRLITYGYEPCSHTLTASCNLTCFFPKVLSSSCIQVFENNALNTLADKFVRCSRYNTVRGPFLFLLYWTWRMKYDAGLILAFLVIFII